MHQGAKFVRQVNWDWNAGAPRYLDNGQVAPEDISMMWDCDWWRARQCGDLWQPIPRWRVGTVYVPGSLSGLWQGRWVVSTNYRFKFDRSFFLMLLFSSLRRSPTAGFSHRLHTHLISVMKPSTPLRSPCSCVSKSTTTSPLPPPILPI